jgi:adenosylcobyric acid synthase
MTARPFFIGGTSSNAGKSWMATAICAWLRARGVSVAPFKAQNMSNNSYVCAGGGEIGRAQVAQAEACGLAPEPSMNPILLKPAGQGVSQVVVHGRLWKTLKAREYYAHAPALRARVLEAYEDLSRRFDVIVIEGAGSVSELNLREHDLVNLGFAASIGAPYMLVADIERGGVFASVAGTVQLLRQQERALFQGFAINKFRGDLSLFDEGVELLEDLTASPCFGVFPFATDVYLDPEDTLSLETRTRAEAPPGARVAIVRLPHLSNATDFRLLTWADWVTKPAPVDYDFIVLPGTKNTIADLEWLRDVGLASWIQRQHARGAVLIGICGGYQMLGQKVRDPDATESGSGEVDGLAFLAASTTMLRTKLTRTVEAVTPGGVPFGAYEIHLGRTDLPAADGTVPFARLSDGSVDGVRAGRVIGTYLHGAFEHPAVCAEIFGIDAPVPVSKQQAYRRLASWFDEHVKHVDRLDSMIAPTA